MCDRRMGRGRGWSILEVACGEGLKLGRVLGRSGVETGMTGESVGSHFLVFGRAVAGYILDLFVYHCEARWNRGVETCN